MNATEPVVTHYWGLGGLSHCGRDVGMQNGHAYTNNWDTIDCPECLVYKPGREKFYVTFGVMYRHEQHKHWPAAHPDGWLEVRAKDYGAARDLVEQYVGNVFAFMYEEDRFDRKWYPLGALATITPDGVIPAEGVEPPTPLPHEEPKRTVRVSWYTTEHFTADIEVDGDFDLNGDDAEEKLEQRICELDQAELDGAFMGTTDRQITDKSET